MAIALVPLADTAMAQVETPPITTPNPPCKVAGLPSTVTELMEAPMALQTKIAITTFAT
jgi:hypothetical protein